MTQARDLFDIEPMLLSEAPPALAPDGPEWTVECKYDGYRLLASIEDDRVRLKTRNGTDATAWYPELRSLASLASGTILDGEVAVLDDIGRSDFERLHARSRRRRFIAGGDSVVYCAFDVLLLGGKDVRAWPLVRRKQALARLLSSPIDHVLFVQDMPGEVRWLYAQAVALKLEGVVAKRLDSPYQDGIRSADWVKIKRPGAVPAQRFKR